MHDGVSLSHLQWPTLVTEVDVSELANFCNVTVPDLQPCKCSQITLVTQLVQRCRFARNDRALICIRTRLHYRLACTMAPVGLMMQRVHLLLSSRLWAAQASHELVTWDT